MPKFIYYHAKAPEMPPEGMQMVIAAIKAGQPDEFGVTPLNAFFSPATGEAYCYTEGPSADAVCKSHESKGIPLGKGDVREVQSFV